MTSHGTHRKTDEPTDDKMLRGDSVDSLSRPWVLWLLFAMGGSLTCTGGDNATPRRAILLDPTHSAWQEHAPEVFTAIVETTKGAFAIEVRRAWAPLGADRFYNLARHGFYDDSRFFRVIENFIAQFGIPGDPEVTSVWKDRAFKDDSVGASNRRGYVTFAMTGPDTRTTQLYINLIDNVRLDSTGFSPIGRVVAGMDVVDSLYSGYGEDAGGGMRGGLQGRMLSEGNAHLDVDSPNLDQIIRIVIKVEVDRFSGSQLPVSADSALSR